jgi:transcriptional regulator with PAS, ATPase and Fis domain
LLSIIRDPRYNKPINRRPLHLRTVKWEKILSSTSQNLLKREGIDFSTCRNPDVKWATVERTHGRICDKIQKYLTHYNTLRFIHDQPKFVAAYNDSVHTSTGMAPARVGEKDVLKIFLRAKHRQQGIPNAKPKFTVGQNVRFSKQKAKFQIFCPKLFHGNIQNY